MMGGFWLEWPYKRVVFGWNGLIRGVVFGSNGLIRGMVLGWNDLIRGEFLIGMAF